MTITEQEKAYFQELVAQIVTTHGDKAAEALLADPVAVVTAAHERRQAFIQEILDGRSDRSKMAKIALCASVYSQAVAISAAERAIEHCGHIADHSYRKSIGFA